MSFDLHVHTTASDGDTDAKGIIEKAHNNCLDFMAITDHDTTDNISKCIKEAEKYEIRIIPGVEISVDYPKGTMHILGYGIDITDDKLTLTLQKLRDSIKTRNQELLDILKRQGIELCLEDITAFSKGSNIRRPHIARAMVKKGYVKTVQEAFDLYLGSDEINNIERFKLDVKTTIDLIRDAGGIAVLAHPYSLNLSPSDTKRKIQELKKYGLSGIEAFHSNHTLEQMETYFDFATQEGLIVTCGSDFHGKSVKPKIELGKGINNNLPTSDYKIVLNLLKKIKAERDYKRTDFKQIQSK